MKDVHVIPINDIREHDESRFCWCAPMLKRDPGDLDAAVVVVHNSADGRELIEEHGIQ